MSWEESPLFSMRFSNFTIAIPSHKSSWVCISIIASLETFLRRFLRHVIVDDDTIFYSSMQGNCWSCGMLTEACCCSCCRKQTWRHWIQTISPTMHHRSWCLFRMQSNESTKAKKETDKKVPRARCAACSWRRFEFASLTFYLLCARHARHLHAAASNLPISHAHLHALAMGNAKRGSPISVQINSPSSLDRKTITFWRVCG